MIFSVALFSFRNDLSWVLLAEGKHLYINIINICFSFKINVVIYFSGRVC